MPWGRDSVSHRFIRPIAICVFRRDGQTLVSEGYDSVKESFFYRPLGGSIEFGEHSRGAIAREIREEIGADITSLKFLGAIESVFTVDGNPGHEIVMVYEGEFVDSSIYEMPRFTGHEDDGSEISVVWKSMDEFKRGTSRLVPDGLLELLSSG